MMAEEEEMAEVTKAEEEGQQKAKGGESTAIARERPVPVAKAEESEESSEESSEEEEEEEEEGGTSSDEEGAPSSVPTSVCKETREELFARVRAKMAVNPKKFPFFFFIL